MDFQKRKDSRHVVCRGYQTADSASKALQTGTASPIRDSTRRLDGLDLRHKGSCHSLWLLSQGVEEAPGHRRGALQQQICQHHPWRQVVAADAGDACRDAQLLTPPLNCSGICQPLDIQHQPAADTFVKFAAEGAWRQLVPDAPACRRQVIMYRAAFGKAAAAMGADVTLPCPARHLHHNSLQSP